MQPPDTYVMALVTFSLGIISAAYGVQIGKSLESRKELLEKMRDWIDEILLEISALYTQEILDERKVVDGQGNRLAFGIHQIRWIGIVQGLRSSRLLLAANEFLDAVKEFDKKYDAAEKLRDDNLKRKEDLFLLVSSVVEKARILHDAITRESVQTPFWLVRPYWRLSPAVKWMILIVIIIVILLATGFYFKFF